MQMMLVRVLQWGGCCESVRDGCGFCTTSGFTAFISCLLTSMSWQRDAEWKAHILHRTRVGLDISSTMMSGQAVVDKAFFLEYDRYRPLYNISPMCVSTYMQPYICRICIHTMELYLNLDLQISSGIPRPVFVSQTRHTNFISSRKCNI